MIIVIIRIIGIIVYIIQCVIILVNNISVKKHANYFKNIVSYQRTKIFIIYNNYFMITVFFMCKRCLHDKTLLKSKNMPINSKHGSFTKFLQLVFLFLELLF